MNEEKISERRRNFIEMKAKRKADREERYRQYYAEVDRHDAELKQRGFWYRLWYFFFGKEPDGPDTWHLPKEPPQ